MKRPTVTSNVDMASCALAAAVVVATVVVVRRHIVVAANHYRPFGADLAVVCGRSLGRSNASRVFVSFKPSIITVRR